MSTLTSLAETRAPQEKGKEESVLKRWLSVEKCPLHSMRIGVQTLPSHDGLTTHAPTAACTPAAHRPSSCTHTIINESDKTDLAVQYMIHGKNPSFRFRYTQLHFFLFMDEGCKTPCVPLCDLNNTLPNAKQSVGIPRVLKDA